MLYNNVIYCFSYAISDVWVFAELFASSDQVSGSSSISESDGEFSESSKDSLSNVFPASREMRYT
jgi:hypothetical protein